jgi:glycosyltransferase involved in cell wall biosynthesis
MMRIGILAEGLAEWQGGIDFLRMVCDCLRLALADDPDGPPHLLLLYPRVSGLEAVRRAADPWLRWLSEGRQAHRLRPFREVLREQREQTHAHQLARLVDVLGSEIPVRRFASDEELAAVARAEQLACLLPSYRALARWVRTPWVGYVFDFQHRHLPHLFAVADRDVRDARFAAMAESATHIVVNSRAVADDCRRFLGAGGATFVPLPFGAAPAPAWFADEPGRLGKYALPPRYFLVSNQFWTHKNHRVVFEALRQLVPAQAARDVGVVCTGSIVDARDKGHFPSLRRFLDENGLAARVRILDHIAKRDQIEIMKGALAVIQPTLFEGGPGGGAVYDAVSLGVPSLVSDLPVNRELDGLGFPVRFFPPTDASALAALMLDCVRGPAPARQDAAALLAEGRERRRAVGKVLVATLRAAIAASGSQPAR